ncbi:CCAAT/enhancer-binding protein delta-like [Pollicipes pollicipes]|uniref:CCAAT/enhancer-binding protein delta-like n=1 Tax=Pollicipes pollicipes TaxID=41117 RepID=UPI001884CB01|nr:CCAAT/enhancer-binding protein delta-like [Pollicipes pollicipes]
MESPQMYDLSDAVVKPNLLSVANKAKLGGPYGEEFGDLADLGASEVSLDLQAFVNDPHFSDGIFPDIVDGKGLGVGLGGRVAAPSATCSGLTYPSGGYLPPAQPTACAGPPRLPAATSHIPVKKDPDASEYHAYRPPPGSAYPGVNVYSPAYTSLTPSSSGGMTASRPAAPAPARPAASKQPGGGSKRVDRTSEEYRRRRERNNVAVRRSREKAKVRSRETEERVKLLARENDGLHKRIEILSKELNVLKNLFANVGVLPDQLHREIAKHLGDGFNRPQPPSGL